MAVCKYGWSNPVRGGANASGLSYPILLLHRKQGPRCFSLASEGLGCFCQSGIRHQAQMSSPHGKEAYLISFVP